MVTFLINYQYHCQLKIYFFFFLLNLFNSGVFCLPSLLEQIKKKGENIQLLTAVEMGHLEQKEEAPSCLLSSSHKLQSKKNLMVKELMDMVETGKGS